MMTELAFDIPLFFASLLYLSSSLIFRVVFHVLSYPLTLCTPMACIHPLFCSLERFLVSSTLSCFRSGIGPSPVNRFLQDTRTTRPCTRLSLLGCIRYGLALPYHLVIKLLGYCAKLCRRTTLDTFNTFFHPEELTTAISASTVSIAPPTLDTPGSDDSTELNVFLESSSGSFIDVTIASPTTPTDVLTKFIYTLSPASPPSSAKPLRSPPVIFTSVSSEGASLMTDDSEERSKSAAAICTLKRRQPFTELSLSKNKNKLRTKPQPGLLSSLLKAPGCKIQTTSSNGKENQMPPPNIQAKGAYYRKDTFMNALKMDMIPIGEGGFGQVFRATAVGDQTIAVKLMHRGTMTQDIAILNEIQALTAAKGCEWVVELIYFQTVQEQALIALSYLPCGDMHNYWERSGFFLDLITARFYIAQLILAIHDLHSRGIIHRDIKLENMMLDSQLNLKLVDFGLAQVFEHTTVSQKDFPLFHELKRLGGDAFPLLWATIHNPHQTDLANGTEGYAPPEVWKCQSHSFGIDYFAMGCCLHMLITSNAPFEFDQVARDYTYDKISVDKTMDADAYDFLNAVLAHNPMNRLNVRRMKMHPVFYGIDWNALAAGLINAPPILVKG